MTKTKVELTFRMRIITIVMVAVFLTPEVAFSSFANT